MGRRSSHTPGELRQLILTSTRAILEQDGYNALSAREIAKKIGYSAGTLYNVFKNLDDLLLTVQEVMLSDAITALKTVPVNGDARRNVAALADRYIGYAMDNRRLWNLLFQHHLPPGKPQSKTLDDTVEAIVASFADALRPLMADRPTADVDQIARVIWASVHGISAIAVTDKTAAISAGNARHYVAQLVEGVLCGLQRN